MLPLLLNTQLPIRLLHTLAFGLAVFSFHGFAIAQEKLDPGTIKIRTYRQEFKESKFKSLYSPSIYDDAQGPITRFDPVEREEFNMIETEMRYMIHVQEQNHTTNHLCAVGYILKSGKREVAVIWREAGLLIGWGGGGCYLF